MSLRESYHGDIKCHLDLNTTFSVIVDEYNNNIIDTLEVLDHLHVKLEFDE